MHERLTYVQRMLASSAGVSLAGLIAKALCLDDSMAVTKVNYTDDLVSHENSEAHDFVNQAKAARIIENY